MRPLTLALLVALPVALPSAARAADVGVTAKDVRTVEGVRLPRSVALKGRVLRLNGAGLRKKLWFKAYVGALYLETPGTSAADIVASAQHKRLELVFLRDVDRETLVRTVQGGFEKNSTAELPALRERLQTLLTAMPAVARHDHLVLEFVPGEGVVARLRTMQLAVPGDDFARALLKVWLGPASPRDELRSGLLEGGR